jgi:hypothetical protein
VEGVCTCTSKSLKKRASKKGKKRIRLFFCAMNEGKFGAEYEVV